MKKIQQWLDAFLSSIGVKNPKDLPFYHIDESDIPCLCLSSEWNSSYWFDQINIHPLELKKGP